MTDVSQEMVARVADWLNAFKADPFSTGRDKAERLLEIVEASQLASVVGERDALRSALERIKGHAFKLRKGTDDWFELVEIEAMAVAALSTPSERPKGDAGEHHPLCLPKDFRVCNCPETPKGEDA